MLKPEALTEVEVLELIMCISELFAELSKTQIARPPAGTDSVGLLVLGREPLLMDKFPGDAAAAAQGATL